VTAVKRLRLPLLTALSLAALGVIVVGVLQLRSRGHARALGGLRGANVLLVTLDTTRADRIGCYGYADAETRTLDGLARDGVLFESCITPTAFTLPSHASIMTGLYPQSHGIPLNGGVALADAQTTMAERLSEAGYRTGAFVGDRDYSREFGHTGRFEHLYDAVDTVNGEDWHAAGVLSRTVSRAISWIRANRDGKLFAFVQGYDVHCPFAVPVANPAFDPEWRGDIDFTRVHAGDRLWKTSDPELDRRLRQTFF
jgi:arylsulfatase A-like enzyme